MLQYQHIQFPNPGKASDEGLIAMGGNLTPDMIISAYSQGIFPWFEKDDNILWWSPNPRMVLMPNEFKASKSLLQDIRNKNYKVAFDTTFREVIYQCSTTPRKGQLGTWITNNMIEAYCTLHELGIGHSVEVCENGNLIGGLYGLSLGKVFFGESMFHHRNNASKIALYFLCKYLDGNNFDMIDVQQSTAHLKSLGAKDLDRTIFLKRLDTALQKDVRYEKWSF